MADADNPETGEQGPNGASRAFLDHLNDSGFFKQIEGIEENLKTLSGDLKVLGDATIERLQETESLVAHVLAVEAVLRGILATHEIDADKVRAEVKERTAAPGENENGNQTVLSIVDDLLSK